ncbi:MAG: hypothetical protein Q7T80_16710, partial [Methanoregula sp.]|nr:hypothetical protein [Methanoregula sp.]
TAANKLMGHGVFRLYQGAPSFDRSQIAMNAEKVVKTRYPDSPILSEVFAIYSGGYPMLCRMITVRNMSSGGADRIIVDAFTQEIVPDQPSEDYKGREYAWSYLDSIPQGEWPDRLTKWELQESNASRVVEYALAQGIDIRLPLSEKNASIIRNYSAAVSPGPSFSEPDRTPEIPDAHPITDELIRKNVVPVETAREHALVDLWRIVIDKPDSFAFRSWRNTTLGKDDPAVIEDFEGRKLYYVFGVKRDGIEVSEIIVSTNKGLYSHPWGLETPVSEYQLVNATQNAREIASRDFPGSSVLSVRPVYSLADNCCHNVTIMLEVENPGTRGTSRIFVDTYTLNGTVESVNTSKGTDTYPSLFSRVTPGDFADNSKRWEKADEQVRNLTGYAKRSGINPDQPLSNVESITLGTHIFLTESRYFPSIYDRVHPTPGARPTLEKSIQVWHEQADWFSGINVDSTMTDAEIARLVDDYVSSGHRLKIYPIQWSSGNYGYYLNATDADYPKAFSILKEDRSVSNRELEYNMDFVQEVKQKNGNIIIPLGVMYPVEANVMRLAEKGVNLAPMKLVYIEYDTPTESITKAQREKSLAELNADDRVLFAFKEYPS